MNLIILDNSKLYINDIEICDCLHPCILTKGIYNIEINYSPKFKTKLPLIWNEEFTANRGFRIHQGNTLKDSNGCILVGFSDKIGHLIDSKKVLDLLIRIIINNNIDKLIIL